MQLTQSNFTFLPLDETVLDVPTFLILGGLLVLSGIVCMALSHFIYNKKRDHTTKIYRKWGTGIFLSLGLIFLFIGGLNYNDYNRILEETREKYNIQKESYLWDKNRDFRVDHIKIMKKGVD